MAGRPLLVRKESVVSLLVLDPLLLVIHYKVLVNMVSMRYLNTSIPIWLEKRMLSSTVPLFSLVLLLLLNLLPMSSYVLWKHLKLECKPLFLLLPRLLVKDLKRLWLLRVSMVFIRVLFPFGVVK